MTRWNAECECLCVTCRPLPDLLATRKSSLFLFVWVWLGVPHDCLDCVVVQWIKFLLFNPPRRLHNFRHQVFSRNIHDPSLPIPIQTTSVRLLLNLVDYIFHNDDADAQRGKRLLQRVLKVRLARTFASTLANMCCFWAWGSPFIRQVVSCTSVCRRAARQILKDAVFDMGLSI